MRVVIIEDKDAVSLLDQLRLESMETQHYSKSTTAARIAKEFPSDYRAMIDEIHRAFHYVVTRWLQDQGAKTTR